MKTELPSFEGREVQAGVAKFNGRTSSRVGAFHDGESVVIIAKARVSGITHEDFKVSTGKGAKLHSRIHKLDVTKAVVMSDEDGGRLLEEAITMADEKFGIQNLFSEIAAASEGLDDPDVDE